MLDFTYKEILGIISLMFIVPQVYLYIKSILNGGTKPHVYTKIIWFILALIGFIIQYKGGGGPGAWVLLGTCLTQLVVLSLCFKYGTRDITKFDTFLLVLALLCIPLYLGVENKLIALVVVLFIDFLGYIPTFRKTYKDPYSEDLFVWCFTNIKFVIAIFALTEYNVHTLSYLVFLLSANTMLIVMMYFRRKYVKKEVSENISDK